MKGVQVVRANAARAPANFYTPQQGTPGYAGYIPETGGTAHTQYAFM